MNTNKMTKKDSFSAVRAILVSANAPKDLLAFIDHEVELLNTKSANRKPSKTQKLSIELSGIVIAVLTNADKPLTVEGIQAVDINLRVFNGEDITPQRITSILTKLIKEGKVTKEVIKRKTHYSWVNTIQDNATDVEEDCEPDDTSDCKDCEPDDTSDCKDCEPDDTSDYDGCSFWGYLGKVGVL